MKTCEILKEDRTTSRSNYHGCAVMEDGTTRDIYFTNYDETLMERVNTLRCNRLNSAYERRGADRNQVERWFKGIEWVFTIYMAWELCIMISIKYGWLFQYWTFQNIFSLFTSSMSLSPLTPQ